MDNLAHTLLGLSLAKTGLEKTTPLATTALVLSSNLPDIDVMPQLFGGTPAYLEFHRGFTHSLLGLIVLAAGLTAALTLMDRLFRLRHDPFGRPVMALRIFMLSLVGGLGHAVMDFTNVYGVRLLEPFRDRWFYGDLIFIVDPWIWLILGAPAVWLTARGAWRALIWLAIGAGLGALMVLALRAPSQYQLTVPVAARIVWFVGMAVVLLGAIAGWGRAGPSAARWSLMILVFYYGAMWLAHRSAERQALASPPAKGAISSIAAWPVPADPTTWQAAATANDSLFRGKINLRTKRVEWEEAGAPPANPELPSALRASPEASTFLSFARYQDWQVHEEPEGYQIAVRDLRFSLTLRARVDRDLNVTSAMVSW